MISGILQDTRTTPPSWLTDTLKPTQVDKDTRAQTTSLHENVKKKQIQSERINKSGGEN